MWIRSQDKRNLVNCVRIWIRGSEKTYYICGSTYNNEYVLGKYNSKQRALEILDDIQYMLSTHNELFQIPEE